MMKLANTLLVFGGSGQNNSNNSPVNGKKNTPQYIFTGYYGQVNNNIQQEITATHQSNKKPSSKNRVWKEKASSLFFNNSNNAKSRLYPKPKLNSRRNNENKQDLYEQYLTQKRAEHEFNILQHQISYVESLIRMYPYLTSYYSIWLRQAEETLKSYSNILESPDMVSFSSVYGYSKDEDLVTLYRHPIFQTELNNSSSRNTSFNQSSLNSSTTSSNKINTQTKNPQRLHHHHHHHHHRNYHQYLNSTMINYSINSSSTSSSNKSNHYDVISKTNQHQKQQQQQQLHKMHSNKPGHHLKQPMHNQNYYYLHQTNPISSNNYNYNNNIQPYFNNNDLHQQFNTYF